MNEERGKCVCIMGVTWVLETACYRTRRGKVWKRIFWGADFRSYRRVRNARRKKEEKDQNGNRGDP